jgi:hypothetical protein
VTILSLSHEYQVLLSSSHRPPATHIPSESIMGVLPTALLPLSLQHILRSGSTTSASVYSKMKKALAPSQGVHGLKVRQVSRQTALAHSAAHSSRNSQCLGREVGFPSPEHILWSS